MLKASLARQLSLGLLLAGVGSSLGACGDGCGVDRGAGPKLGADPSLVAQNLLASVPADLVNRVDAAFAAPSGGGAPAAAAAGVASEQDPGISAVYLGVIVEADVDVPAAPGADAAAGSDEAADSAAPADSAAAAPAAPASAATPGRPGNAALAALVPGEAVRLRHFWKVVRPPGAGLRVVTYLRGYGATPDFMNLDDSPMRLAHPPETWRAGEIIQDVQTFVLRPDWRTAEATLLVGMMKRGGHGEVDRVAVKRGPAQAGMVTAVTLPVDLSKAPPPPGTVRVEKATTPIVIDGEGSEEAWQALPWSMDFQTAEGSPEPGGAARGKLLWDDANLYALVHVDDSDVASPYVGRDDPLWKADCVELFIDADRNGRQYIELQVNPNNAQFDSYFATTREQPGDVSFDAKMTSQVAKTDAGWEVEIAIPWEAVRGMDPQMPVRLPPLPGDAMRLNVVRVDKKAADKNVTASSWNRITYADFHALDRMLNVVLVAGAAAPDRGR